jgi:multidrug efflux pump
MNRFFVSRPVFAWVIALFTVLFGGIAVLLLPVEQYPDVAPPSLNIQASFSGADAHTLERSVTSIIEDEMNGIENFMYMSSISRSNGTAQITVVLKPGTNLDIARTQVQDRLSRVEPRLPLEVRQLGVTVTKASSGFLMLLALQTTDGATSAVAMGNFASNNIINELRRIEGVGDVQLFGSSYAMRIWLDQRKLAGFGLSASEVLSAVQEQNSQTAGGGLGDQPNAEGSEFTAQIVTQSRLSTPEQFREIIVRANPDGSTVRLGDVARVELGNDSYGRRLTVNGKESAGIAIQLASGANALAVANAVRARMAQLQPTFPRGVVWTVPFDTTPFITTSVHSVIQTMIEALLLVTVVVFLFLQDWRATLIPTLVVPVALIGTCAGLYLFGMSINILSLFGMVVAIGILNDDAIVVVENVARIMREEGLSAPRATVKAVGQISGAVIASTLVLVAVFIPMAFFPGSVGGIYRQFSVTLAVSIILSTLLALTLGAALCAALLRNETTGSPASKNVVSRLLHHVFDRFNRGLGAATARYIRGVESMLTKPLRWLLVFVVACVITGFLFVRLPSGFLPTEDQGHLFIAYTGAPGSTEQRTEQAAAGSQRDFGSGLQLLRPGTIGGLVVCRPEALGRTSRRSKLGERIGSPCQWRVPADSRSDYLRARPTSYPVFRNRDGFHDEDSGSQRRGRRRAATGGAADHDRSVAKQCARRSSLRRPARSAATVRGDRPGQGACAGSADPPGKSGAGVVVRLELRERLRVRRQRVARISAGRSRATNASGRRQRAAASQRPR